MLQTKLVSRKRFKDYDVSGISDIHRAAVPYGIKIGEYFNVYRGKVQRTAVSGWAIYNILY